MSLALVYNKPRSSGWLICFSLFLLLLTGCSSVSYSGTKAATKTNPTRVTSSLQQPSYSCQLQRTPIDNPSSLPEIHGSAQQSELWALLQSTTGVPPHANSLVKIVWRMTGTGVFSLIALGPQEERLPPDQGPVLHSGSSWNRPGNEWGSDFRFPTSGCWDLHASRGNGASGDVWLSIVQ